MQSHFPDYWYWLVVAAPFVYVLGGIAIGEYLDFRKYGSRHSVVFDDELLIDNPDDIYIRHEHYNRYDSTEYRRLP